MGLDDRNGVYKTLFASLDEVEKKIGKTLTSSDPQYSQFEDMIEKSLGSLSEKKAEDLAMHSEVEEAKGTASKVKSEVESAKARAGN